VAYKPSLKNVTLSIGGTMLQTRGSIIPIKDSTETRETRLSMLDDAGHKVKQVYVCGENTCTPADGGPGWTVSQLKLRGREENGQMVVLTPEDLADDDADALETGVLQLDVRPAKQVDGQTWPGQGAYWFEPDRPDPFYGFLSEAARNTDVALIGVMRARGADKLYRVVPFIDGFALQEILRPQDVRDFTAPTANLGDKERDMGNQLMDALVEDFDPAEYASDKVAKLRELLAAKAGTGAPVAPKTKAAKTAEPDLGDALAAALAAAKAGKKGKKAG
jgi:non-homologous end joining protein Ku